MRITLGRLREMVEDAVGAFPSEWEPAAEDVRLIGYQDEEGEPVEEDADPLDRAYVIFTVQGPWSKGPLEVDASSSFLYTVAKGQNYGDPYPSHVRLYWTHPHVKATWDEVGTSVVSIAKAAMAAGILL